MHDSFNYQFLGKSKEKQRPTKTSTSAQLSTNPSINGVVTTITTNASAKPAATTTPATSDEMAYSHTIQQFLPSTSKSDPRLPDRFKPQGLAPLRFDDDEVDQFEDLIMLAEFSEQEGPRPLLILSAKDFDYSKKVDLNEESERLEEGALMSGTLSETQTEESTNPPTDQFRPPFDANSFAVRIMSVDASIPPIIGALDEDGSVEDDQNFDGSQQQDYSFRLAQDSVVIHLEATDENVVSHVRHFTLYDLDARGFVRPFCVAYVTKSSGNLCTAQEGG